MEMHQIRYFLAVSRELNFTRAATACNVSQPSLTRAIKLLEEELGGELFRRERNLTHLSELGERMLPLLGQCLESAGAAKSIATAMRQGKVASLKLGIAQSLSLAPFAPLLAELSRTFEHVHLRVHRGAGPDLSAALRGGDIDLMLAPSLPDAWDRLESWFLFEEGFRLVASPGHRLSTVTLPTLADLSSAPMLHRRFCETAPAFAAVLQGIGVDLEETAHLASETDVLDAVAAGLGVALVPQSQPLPTHLLAVPAPAPLDARRRVLVYAAAGRRRGPAASLLLTQLRAAGWP